MSPFSGSTYLFGFGDRDYEQLRRFNPPGYAPPEDGDIIQSPKCYDF
jgi:hypothetical protein